MTGSTRPSLEAQVAQVVTMAKERATEKSEHKKSKDKKLSAQDKVKKSSKNKHKKEKKAKKAKKIAKLEEELDSKPKVEEQVESEDEATNESPVNQEEEKVFRVSLLLMDQHRVTNWSPPSQETADITPVAAGDENQKDSRQPKSEKAEKSPTKNAGDKGDGEAATEKKDKSKKKKKKGDPTQPHLSGLNRTARRRLVLIDRQRAKIEKRMGIEPGSGERKEEVDKAVEKWTKTFDELNARSVEKKALKAKLHTKRRIDKTKKRKEMGLSKKQFDKLKRKEKGGKKGNKKDNAVPAGPAAAAAA